jgi:hypothetical protein
MNKLYATAATLLCLTSATAAFAATTPGVDDTVSCVRVGTSFPNAIQFQTVNGGGDNTMSGTCLGTGATWYCIGIGSGTNAIPNLATVVAQALENSRLANRYVQFTDQGTGYYGDCPRNEHGVSPLDY